MGFRINTNIAAMNAHTSANMTNRNLDSSLEKLSSGLRINKAADDASGMAIADSLRAQSNSLGQAVNNANDAIGIVQIADKAMDEQIKILDTIRTKAIQSAQDGQSADSRAALQKDVNRLMEELDNIATTTSYNGQNLLSGGFTNKEFQIGAYSNETITASIGATNSSKIGHARYETGIASISESISDVNMVFSTGSADIRIESVNIDYSAGSGMGVLADAINKNSDATGVKASYVVESTTSGAVSAGDVAALSINGVLIGNISGVEANDSDGRLVNAINSFSVQTGVQASVDNEGRLNLTSLDGRGLDISTAASAGGISGAYGGNYGRLTLTRLDAKDIVFGVTGNATSLSDVGQSAQATATMNLADVRANITSSDAQALGVQANASQTSAVSGGIGAGLTSLKGAMATIDIAESAQKLLDTIRGDLGSVQNQLVSTINNISVTQVNVKSAESNIRNVDFASESANFSKNQILAQSGSYAMSQANAIQQNVMRLLQ